MSVSRVINGDQTVRPATRQTVQAAITALGYAPNTAARTLAVGGQLRLGLLYNNPNTGYSSELLLGSLEQAARAGVQIIVEKCGRDEHGSEGARRLIKRRVHGVVLPPPLCESFEVLKVLADARIPTVSVATSSSDSQLFSVGIDDRAAAHMMTRHIISLGHTRIGFITGSPSISASAKRLQGYRDALADGEIAFVDELVAEGFFTYRSGLDAAEKLLNLAVAPTAIFASNDDMAAAAVAVAHRLGLDVPGDLTVCGFDDTMMSTAIWPELTTIHQPIAEMSRAAVKLLASKIRGQSAAENAAEHALLEFTLVRRQSDAAPRLRPPARRR